MNVCDLLKTIHVWDGDKPCVTCGQTRKSNPRLPCQLRIPGV